MMMRLTLEMTFFSFLPVAAWKMVALFPDNMHKSRSQVCLVCSPCGTTSRLVCAHLCRSETTTEMWAGDVNFDVSNL